MPDNRTDNSKQKTCSLKTIEKAIKKYVSAVSDEELAAHLLFLWGKQTDREQTSQETVEENKMGFTAYDSEELSSISKQVVNEETVSQKGINIVRHRVPKYWRQFYEGYYSEEKLNKIIQESTTEKKGENDDIAKEKAYFEDDDKLYLEILTKGEDYLYAYRNEDNEVEFIPYFHKKDSKPEKKILPVKLPIKADGEIARVVQLPDEGIKEAVLLRPDALLTKIQAHIKKYCDLEELDLEMCAYYVIFTWFYTKVNTVAYLRFISDTGKGKSRMVKVIGDVCFYPLSASGAGTVSGMMRENEKWHGTLRNDEADINANENSQIIKYYNTGFQKETPFLMTNKTDPTKREVFDPFCPKIFGMRHNFKDVATEGRLLSISPHETSDIKIPIILESEYDRETIQLRNEIAKFVLFHWNNVDGEKMVSFANLGIEPRLQQLAMPLSIIAQLYEDGKEKFVRYMKIRQKQLVKDRAQSWEGMLFNTVYEIATGDFSLDPVWNSYYDHEGEIFGVTPTMVAKIHGTTPNTASKGLRGIGFDVERKNIKIEGKNKTIKCFVLRSEKKWVEIQRRYMDSSDSDDSEIYDAYDGYAPQNYTDLFFLFIYKPIPQSLKSTRYIARVDLGVLSVISVIENQDDSKNKNSKSNTSCEDSTMPQIKKIEELESLFQEQYETKGIRECEECGVKRLTFVYGQKKTRKTVCALCLEKLIREKMEINTNKKKQK